MTTQEAIKCLRDISDGMPFDKCKDWIEACDMAIRSLKAVDRIDDLVYKTYWAYPIGIDYCLDNLEEILKKVGYDKRRSG